MRAWDERYQDRQGAQDCTAQAHSLILRIRHLQDAPLLLRGGLETFFHELDTTDGSAGLHARRNVWQHFEFTMHKRPITAVWPGEPFPIGSTWDGQGVNFALFSAHAEKVELCLFDASGRHELQRLELKVRTDDTWHCYLPQARPGMLYGYRVHGPYRPHDGHRFRRSPRIFIPCRPVG